MSLIKTTVTQLILGERGQSDRLAEFVVLVNPHKLCRDRGRAATKAKNHKSCIGAGAVTVQFTRYLDDGGA